MKLTMPAQNFHKEVAWISRLLPNRPAIAVTAGIRLSATNGQLRATTFDFDTCAHVDMGADVEESGTVLVSGKMLAAAAAQLPHDDLTLTVESTRVRLTCGTASFKLNLMPLEDFPHPFSEPHTVGQVDGAMFADAVARTVVAADTSNIALPVLAGTQIKFDPEGLCLTATDRYRIAQGELDWSPSEGDTPDPVLVKAPTLSYAAKSVTGNTVELGVSGISAGTGFGISNGTRQLITRVLDADLPNVQRVLHSPDDAATLTVDTNRIIEATRRASAITEGTNTPLMLQMGTDELVMSMDSGDDEGRDVVPAKFDGEPLTIGFQPRNLLDGLTNISTATTQIKVTTPTKPVMILPEDGVDYRHMVMPIRLSR